MRLNNGDPLPSVSGPTVGGGSLTIPESGMLSFSTEDIGEPSVICSLQTLVGPKNSSDRRI